MRSERFDTPGPLRIKIEIPSGDVELQTVDGSSTQVELEGPEDIVEEARIELRPKGEGHELFVQTHRRGGCGICRGGCEVALRITPPPGADIEVSAASADIAGRGRLGAVEIEAASGDVSLDRVEGEAKTQTASGDIEIERLEGAGKLQSASGDVRAGEIALQTASGDIEVGIKQGTKAFIDARSMSGETSSDLEVGDLPSEGDGPEVEIKATAMSGDIRIVRA